MIYLAEKSKCSGCHACFNACPKDCIEMIIDSEGFWYPKINNEICINCEKCEKLCPIINPEIIENTPIAYAAYNKNENIRLDSSSGGVFTLFAEQILNNGGVVFGACFNEKFEVVHDYVENFDGLSKFRGSKYVQSNLGDIYKKVKIFLDEDRLVLFTGTPCQIAGLKSFLQNEYNNLVCQDIICHGIPSPKVWQKYVSYREKLAGSSTRRIAFRSKNESWKRFSITFIFENDMEYYKNFEQDLMMIAFLQNICLRPSCYHCSFKTMHRNSDITLADFWGIQNIMPEMDDDKGTSLLILNSNKGKELFDFVKEKLVYKETNLIEAVKYNPSIVSSAHHNSKRQAFFNNLDSLDFDELVKKFCSYNYFVKVRRKICSILSRFKQLIINYNLYRFISIINAKTINIILYLRNIK